MKTSFIIVSLVGISLIGASGLWLVGSQPQTESAIPVKTIKYQGQSIEINGLESPIDGQKQVEFSILGHNLSGCPSVGVLVFREMHYHPPVLQKQFVADCKNNEESISQEYEFPVVINGTDFLESGWYVVRASYFAGRDVYDDVEQKFMVTKTPTLNATKPSRIDTNQYLLEVLDLQSNYIQDREIQFIVHEKGFDVTCPSVFVEIYNSSTNRMWSMPVMYGCPHGSFESEFDIKVPFSGIKIDKVGEYQLMVHSDGYEIRRAFSVIDQNHVR